MKAVWLIIHREYNQRIRKKSFLVLTLLGPVFFALLLIIPAWLSLKKIDNQKIILVYDPTHLLAEDFLKDGVFTLHKLPQHYTHEEVVTRFSESGGYALLYIHNAANASLFFHHDINPATKAWINNLLNQIHVRHLLIGQLGEEQANQLTTEVNLNVQLINPTHSSIDEARNGLSMLSGIIIYLFIITYTMQVMRGVVQEKSNRITEILLTSVRPFQLMLGKITGIALISLTQFAIWFSAAFLLFQCFTFRYGKSLELFGNEKISETISNHPIDIKHAMEWNQLINTFSEIDISFYLFVFGFYFTFGYLFYSAIFAAIGASVDSETDTQPFVFPLTIPILISFALYQTLIEQPDSPLSVFFSIFPFTAPVTIMFLLPYHLPSWQLICSMLSLLISFALAVWLAAKIYRTGILMYGKKVTLKEMIRWLKA